MKITEDRVPRCAPCENAEQVISEGEALSRGMEDKSNELVEKGAEIYAKA